MLSVAENSLKAPKLPFCETTLKHTLKPCFHLSNKLSVEDKKSDLYTTAKQPTEHKKRIVSHLNISYNLHLLVGDVFSDYFLNANKLSRLRQRLF